MVEFIGFLISLFAIIFLFFRNVFLERHPEKVKKRPVPIPGSENDTLDEWIRKMESEIAKEYAPNPPKPQPEKVKVPPKKLEQKKKNLKEYRLESDIEKRKIESSIENRKLRSEIEQRKPRILYAEDHVKKSPPRILGYIGRLNSLKDLVIYHEIFNKPKGL